MNNGQKKHEDDPSIHIFSAWICHKLLPHPKSMWKKQFEQLTENMKYDRDTVRKLTYKYIKEAK